LYGTFQFLVADRFAFLAEQADILSLILGIVKALRKPKKSWMNFALSQAV
jgi:hypothetical protein